MKDDVSDLITSIEHLEQVYEAKPQGAALQKVAYNRLTPLYREWILQSRFCVLSSVGENGTDGSPRGDDGPVVTVLDDSTLAMPDWRGNFRLDSLRNIVTDGRVSLMFMVTGSTTVVRVNGTATLSIAPDLLTRYEQAGKNPKSVIIIKIAEVYTQCAKALMRSRLWSLGDQSEGLPRAGEILSEMTSGEIDADTYERELPDRISKTMW